MAFCAQFPAPDYDLPATLTSGQAFRWQLTPRGWSGVIHHHALLLRQTGDLIEAETVLPLADSTWLRDYLQLDLRLDDILATFPPDGVMERAVATCRGLRLLRQDPWECLASFILSSTKQIVQIQQIVDLLCRRFGDPLPAPDHAMVFSFPTPERIADLDEADLRACKMGFRAPYLLGAARMIRSGEVQLSRLRSLPLGPARDELLRLPGVGPKIADCVLLFAGGFPGAFPVDVWVLKALRQLYFPRRRPSIRRLLEFRSTHFGPNSGYAQQYLFHYMRVHQRATSKRNR